MNSTQQKKCNQCLNLLNKVNIPYKMVDCQHNICQNCFRDLLRSGQTMVQCQFCGKSSKDLNFAKNTKLIKQLSEKIVNFKKKAKVHASIPDINNSTSNLEQQQLLMKQDQFELRQDLQNKWRVYIKDKMCLKHNKPIDIICLTDLMPVCSMCALFTGHKNHKLLPKEEFRQNIQQNQKTISATKHQKYIIEHKKHNFDKNREKIQKLLKDKKIKIKSEVSEKINSFIDQLKTLEKDMYLQTQNYCEKIMKQFQTFKQQGSEINKLQKQYEIWIAKCENTIQNSQNQTDIQGLIEIYQGDGKIIDIQNGAKILTKIDKIWNQNIKNIEEQINSLSINDKSNVKQLSSFLSLKTVTKINNHHQKNYSHLTSVSLKANKIREQSLDNSFINDFSQDQFHSLADITKSSRLLTASRTSLGNILDDDLKKSYRLSKDRKNNNDITKIISPNRQKFVSPSQKIKNNSNKLLEFKSIQKFSHKHTESALVKSRSLDKNAFGAIIKKQQSNKKQRNPEQSIDQFLHSSQKNRKQQILDLSGFNMSNEDIISLLQDIHSKIKSDNIVKKQSKMNSKKIRYLKLNENKLNNQGFMAILPFLGSCTNLNLSKNQLTEDLLDIVISNRDKLAPLRLLNLSKNKVNDKRAKFKLESLRKMGILIQI